MVTHWQSSTGNSEASGNSDLHYHKREVNGGIQQQACPGRVESALSYAFTSSDFSNPNSMVCEYDLTMPHTFRTNSLADVQEASDCLNATNGTALPIPGSSAGVEVLSNYMKQLRLDAAAFSDQDYSPAKTANPYQFQQATFSPTRGFPDVNSQQYYIRPFVRTIPEIAHATSPYDTYRDTTSGQIRNKPLIRSATQRSLKKMHPRTGMPFRPFNVAKRPRVLRSRSRIDRGGEGSSDNTLESSSHPTAHMQICCNYGCGRVFSRADGCKRHMSFCPFRPEK